MEHHVLQVLPLFLLLYLLLSPESPERFWSNTILVDVTDYYGLNGAVSVEEVTIKKAYELSTRRLTIKTVFLYDKKNTK